VTVAASLSVITTVKNEERAVRAFLAALFQQSVPPAEVVVVDAGSTDDTRDAVEGFVRDASPDAPTPVRFVSVPCNRAEGRNLGVALATQELIVAIDVGCVPDRGCLEAIYDHFRSNPSSQVAAGAVRSAPETLFEEATGLLLPGDPSPSAVETGRWLPTSRLIAFRRGAFAAAGGYPEHAAYANEDTHFARRLRAAGVPVAFVPAAVAWWRPRSTWRGFFTQYFNYAFGDGVDLTLSWKYGLKLTVYTTGTALLAGGFRAPALWYVLLGLAAAYAALAAARGWRRCPRVATAALTPLVEVFNDVADVTGYVAGAAARWVGGALRRPTVRPG
jgi:glycosyltransferase involved in cell wall biosynthesis